jgi:hypothetical protein
MSMRAKTLDKAISEANRFLAAAEVVKRSAGTTEYLKGDPWHEGGQHCAAVKRASMDLSRALVDVRRGS